MSLVARITALAQAMGADIKALSNNMLDLAGTRQMTGPLDQKGQTETTFSGGKFDLNGTGDYYIASMNAGAQITGFGTVREGARRLVRFYSGILLTHSDTLVLPGGANIVTQNDDIALFVSRGGGSWRTAFYSRADGTALKAAPDATALDLAGTRAMLGPIREAPFIEVHANAGTIDLAAATGNSVRSNATNSNNTNGQVTSLGALPNGEVRTIRFTSAGTLVHNIGILRLPTEQNIAVREGDTAQFLSHGSGLWENRFYQRGDGTPLAAAAAPVTSVAGRTGAVVLAKGDVGLSNVDNTADANKPVSTAQATAIETKVDKVTGKGLSTEDYTSTEKTKLAGIAAGAQVNAVTSVAGRAGAVTLAKADVGLDQVDNTSDTAKPVSTAQATAIAAKATLAEALAQMQSYGYGAAQLQTSGDADALTESRIQRTTATTTSNRPLGLNGVLLNMQYAANNNGQLYVTSTGRFAWRFNAGATAAWSEGAPLANPSFTNGLSLSASGAAVSAVISGDAGYARNLSFRTGTSGRWDIVCNENAESGANAGSDFALVARTDAGAYLRVPLSINRATGNVTLASLTVNSSADINGSVTLTPASSKLIVQGSGMELGRVDGVASSSYIDLHSGATAVDYDARLLASGGNGTAGGGNLTATCAGFFVSGVLNAQGALAAAGPVKVGQYTLTTLPSASAYNGYEIDVTNATGGPKRCRSNGTVWQILNNTTTVS